MEEEFRLTPYMNAPAAHLPGGYRQRLSMACALLHSPDILFLDEPTSGADPLARRDFWLRINALAEKGVTVIITTHFLGENGKAFEQTFSRCKKSTALSVYL